MSVRDKYIVLDMFKISQMQNGIVFAGKMRFSDLNQVYKFTERKSQIQDNKFGTSEYSLLMDEDGFFQRQISEEKIHKIKKYLEESLSQNKETHNIFPSSVILYNRPSEEDEGLTDNEIDNLYAPDLDCCFYRKNLQSNITDVYQLFIPKNKNITLIVDGQHRFLGTKTLYDSLIKADNANASSVADFEFIVTYLVGFDIYEVSRIFADVNFKQKPVNRSLYYDIFGSVPYTDDNNEWHNEIRLAHDLAVHLNNADDSPIKGMIKLLGKGYGLISQAFFVDTIQNNVFKSGVWNEYLGSYIKGDSKYRIISRFMKDYLCALHEAYPTLFPKKTERNVDGISQQVYSSYEYKGVLWKTTGLGAYLRLIKDIYPIVRSDPNNFFSNIKNIFERIDESTAKGIFSQYEKSGSEGNQSKLYYTLKEKYDLLSNDERFIQDNLFK